MFVPLTEKERQAHFSQNSRSFIPGYTGHCPTLRFYFGTCYGRKTKEILQELQDKEVIRNVESRPYRANDPGKIILKPIPKSKGQMTDYFSDFQRRAPRYIIGYTGFIPTLNFRYGKSYGRTADDSMCEFHDDQRRYRESQEDVERMYRAKSAPKMNALRSEDQVNRLLNEYQETNRFTAKKITANDPPIAGYTGHIPRVKGNEESLSKRYNTVVKRGLTLLERDREKRQSSEILQDKLADVYKKAEGAYMYKDI